MPDNITNRSTSTGRSVWMLGSTAGGGISKANAFVEKLSQECFKQQNTTGFTRLDKFRNTLKSCIAGSAAFGAAAGRVLSAVPDIVLGDGIYTNQIDYFQPTAEGLLGSALLVSGDACSLAGGVAGTAAGAGVGIGLSMIACLKDDGGPCAPLCSGAEFGGRVGSQVVCTLYFLPVSIALAAARLPSLVIKYALTSAMACIGAIAGVVGGSIRAALNR